MSPSDISQIIYRLSYPRSYRDAIKMPLLKLFPENDIKMEFNMSTIYFKDYSY